MRLNWKKLYSSLDEARGGDSWRTLASKVGVTPSLFTRISQEKPISVANLLKVMEILGPRGVLDFIEDKRKK